jgi:hypothetical protein
MDTHPKRDSVLRRLSRFLRRDFLLQFERTSDGIQGSLKYCDVTITRILHDLATMGDDGGIYQANTQKAEAPVGVQLGSLHETGVSDDVRRENRSRPPLEIEDGVCGDVRAAVRSNLVGATIHPSLPMLLAEDG